MQNKVIVLMVVAILSAATFSANAQKKSKEVLQINVSFTAADDEKLVRFAQRELKRYLFLRTGVLAHASIGQERVKSSATIELRIDPKQFAHEEYQIQTKKQTTTITGGSDVALLYGVYRFAELLGVRFYMHGDVVPDTQIPFALPNVSIREKPLFELRGLNPWGSHAHGFDQWNTDDYLAHIGQLAKMRMNFIGMHCYPEKLPFAEPTVWVGQETDFTDKGNVTFSYPARYFSTSVSNQWGGIIPTTTDTYLYGADKLFSAKSFGADVMNGMLTPTQTQPSTPDDCNLLFNRTGEMFNKAFSFAKSIHVKTCLGTEAPLTLPQLVRERLKNQGKNPDDPETVKAIYRGMFKRIAATHPLDYYWIWTDESWTWRDNSSEQTAKVVDDILLAHESLKEIGKPFQLATAGWVVGPKEDRALLDKKLPSDIPISSISRNVGHTPIDSAYRQIGRRAKWAIPWMESDEVHGLNDPQIFVSRTRKDAADALASGCTGLMGLHWRTAEVSPNIAALAQSAWQKDGGKTLADLKPVLHKKYNLHGNIAESDRGLEADDFWADWAENMFGKEIAEEAAAIFSSLDGKLEVIVAQGCPAGILTAYPEPWDKVKAPVNFVDDFCQLESKITSPGNLERFLYWKNFFLYYREQGILRCKLGEYERAKKADNPAELATVKKELEQITCRMMTYLQEYVSTNGGLMTIVFTQQSRYWLPLVAPLIDNPSKEYQGRDRIFINNLRTAALNGEKLTLPVFIHTKKQPKSTTLYWRELGGKADFKKIPLTHLAGSCYQVNLPSLSEQRQEIEYYIEAELDNQSLVFPPTAPQLNQTVVLF
ncbi:hypothetical protein FACS189430_07450 [Bacteroidia bacterium]|nr:hypothetical protein FACS189430_07450 [Bacteroidia bacterium]